MVYQATISRPSPLTSPLTHAISSLPQASGPWYHSAFCVHACRYECMNICCMRVCDVCMIVNYDVCCFMHCVESCTHAISSLPQASGPWYHSAFCVHACRYECMNICCMRVCDVCMIVNYDVCCFMHCV